MEVVEVVVVVESERDCIVVMMTTMIGQSRMERRQRRQRLMFLGFFLAMV